MVLNTRTYLAMLEYARAQAHISFPCGKLFVSIDLTPIVLDAIHRVHCFLFSSIVKLIVAIILALNCIAR